MNAAVRIGPAQCGHTSGSTSKIAAATANLVYRLPPGPARDTAK